MSAPRLAPSLKQLATEKAYLLGGFIFSPDANISTLYAKAGYDFVVLDMEHCMNGLPGIQVHLRACAAAGIAALVRIGASNLPDVGRLLDGGAQGIAFPHLGLPGAGVAQAISSMRYAPQGKRPACTGVPAAGFGLDDFAAYAAASDAAVLSLGLVEDREAVDDLDRVLEDSSVDWIMPGPADLATSYGVPGNLRHPKVIAAMDTIQRAARRRDILTGAYVNAMDEIAAGVATGARFFVHSIDYKVLGRALRASVDGFGDALARC